MALVKEFYGLEVLLQSRATPLGASYHVVYKHTFVYTHHQQQQLDVNNKQLPSLRCHLTCRYILTRNLFLRVDIPLQPSICLRNMPYFCHYQVSLTTW